MELSLLPMLEHAMAPAAAVDAIEQCPEAEAGGEGGDGLHAIPYGTAVDSVSGASPADRTTSHRRARSSSVVAAT